MKITAEMVGRASAVVPDLPLGTVRTLLEAAMAGIDPPHADPAKTFYDNHARALCRALFSAIETTGLPGSSPESFSCHLETLARNAQARGDNTLSLILDMFRSGPTWKLNGPLLQDYLEKGALCERAT